MLKLSIFYGSLDKMAALQIDPVPKLHARHDDDAYPQYRFLGKRSGVRNEFIERTLAPE